MPQNLSLSNFLSPSHLRPDQLLSPLLNHILLPIFQNFESLYFKRYEVALLSRLLPVLNELVEAFLPLSNERLTEAATTQKPQSALIAGEKEDIVGIATKLAHLSILHWRVWSNIAYLDDPDNHGSEESEA